MKKNRKNKKHKKAAKSKGGSEHPADEARNLRNSLSHVFASGWTQNFTVGLLFFIAAILIGAFMRNPKTLVLAVATALTVVVWIFAVAILRQIGSVRETEIHGLLEPANQAMPDNPCPEIPANALVILLGRSAAYSSASLHTVLRIRGDEVLSFRRVNDKIAINARVFSRDGRIVAEIRDNEFFINPNNYFRRERPNAHSLTVFDQENRRVLDVFYINPRAIRFSGIFNYPQREVIISDNAGLFRNTICFGENQTDVVID